MESAHDQVIGIGGLVRNTKRLRYYTHASKGVLSLWARPTSESRIYWLEKKKKLEKQQQQQKRT